MHRHVLVLLAASIAGAVVAAGAQQPTFRAGSDAVRVFATVTDRDGKLVTNLTQDQFELRDDGKPQPITQFDNRPQPIRMIVMLDVSGSMEGNLPLLRAAGAQLFGRLLPEDVARVGAFGHDVTISESFTHDPEALNRAMPERIAPDAPTPLWRAIDQALDAFAEVQDMREVILVLSDGKDTGSFSFRQKPVSQAEVDRSRAARGRDDLCGRHAQPRPAADDAGHRPGRRCRRCCSPTCRIPASRASPRRPAAATPRSASARISAPRSRRSPTSCTRSTCSRSRRQSATARCTTSTCKVDAGRSEGARAQELRRAKRVAAWTNSHDGEGVAGSGGSVARRCRRRRAGGGDADARAVAARVERGDRLELVPPRRARRRGHVAPVGGGRDLGRGDALPQLLLPAAGRHVLDRRGPELGRAVRLPRRQPGREQPVGGRARPHARSRRPARRARAAVRLEPRRAADDRQPRSAVGAGAIGRPPVRSRVRRHRPAARGRVGHFRSRRAHDRARPSRADQGVRVGADLARVRRLRPHLRRPSDDDGRWAGGPARAAASRHQADRHPRGGRPCRSRPARSTRWPAWSRSRSSARSFSRSARRAS